MMLVALLILLTVTPASAYHVPDGYAHGSQWGPTMMPISPPESLDAEPQTMTQESIAAKNDQRRHGACVIITDDGPPFEFCEELPTLESWLKEQANGLNCRARLTAAIREVREELTLFGEVTWGDPLLLNPARLGEQAKKIDTLLQECP